MRTWIKQPDDSNLCGQIAVAVVAGISLDESIKLVGKKGCTKTKDLAKALRKLGYKCPDRCKRYPKEGYRSLCIAQLHNPSRKSGWHWVVVDGYHTFDGINGNSSGSVRWNDDWKITSYLPISI